MLSKRWQHSFLVVVAVLSSSLGWAAAAPTSVLLPAEAAGDSICDAIGSNLPSYCECAEGKGSAELSCSTTLATVKVAFRVVLDVCASPAFVDLTSNMDGYKFDRKIKADGKALHIAIPGLSFSIPYLASAGAYLDGIMTGNADKITVSLSIDACTKATGAWATCASSLYPGSFPLVIFDDTEIDFGDNLDCSSSRSRRTRPKPPCLGLLVGLLVATIVIAGVRVGYAVLKERGMVPPRVETGVNYLAEKAVEAYGWVEARWVESNCSQKLFRIPPGRTDLTERLLDDVGSDEGGGSAGPAGLEGYRPPAGLDAPTPVGQPTGPPTQSGPADLLVSVCTDGIN